MKCIFHNSKFKFFIPPMCWVFINRKYHSWVLAKVNTLPGCGKVDNLGKSSGINTISVRKTGILRIGSCVPHIQSAGSSILYHISHEYLRNSLGGAGIMCVAVLSLPLHLLLVDNGTVNCLNFHILIVRCSRLFNSPNQALSMVLLCCILRAGKSC